MDLVRTFATLANRIDSTATFWLFLIQSYAVYWLGHLYVFPLAAIAAVLSVWVG